jgi:hypothetical protein
METSPEKVSKYPVVAALVSMDVSYEHERPVYVRPVILTSEGFQVREANGRPARESDECDVEPGQLCLWSEEKVLGMIPVDSAFLVQSTAGQWFEGGR